MKARRKFKFFTVCQTVRTYQGQIVPSIGTKSTLVPLAKIDDFSRLSAHPFLPVAE
jgi:hypothetical protein